MAPTSEPPTIQLTHGRNPNTTLRIHMLGATVTSWKQDGQEMLYLSKQSTFDGRHAMGIRGGVSLYFPHIGPWMFGPTNGFAMSSREWKVYQTPQTNRKNGDVKVVLALEDSENTRKMWSRKFLLLYTIVLTENSIALRADVTNKVGSLNFKMKNVNSCSISG